MKFQKRVSSLTLDQLMTNAANKCSDSARTCKGASTALALTAALSTSAVLTCVPLCATQAGAPQGGSSVTPEDKLKKQEADKQRKRRVNAPARIAKIEALVEQLELAVAALDENAHRTSAAVGAVANGSIASEFVMRLYYEQQSFNGCHAHSYLYMASLSLLLLLSPLATIVAIMCLLVLLALTYIPLYASGSDAGLAMDLTKERAVEQDKIDALYLEWEELEQLLAEDSDEDALTSAAPKHQQLLDDMPALSCLLSESCCCDNERAVKLLRTSARALRDAVIVVCWNEQNWGGCALAGSAQLSWLNCCCCGTAATAAASTAGDVYSAAATAAASSDSNEVLLLIVGHLRAPSVCAML
eukprot:10082-Heterococcus_DN1.PRE.3